jgi:hypothetical protein
MERLEFQFVSAGGATVHDTGGPVFGRLHAVRWDKASGVDTGGTLLLTQCIDGEDTGPNVQRFSLGCTPSGWVKHPRTPPCGPDGIEDTGADGGHDRALFIGERLRITLVPGSNAGLTGRAWVWIE